jgi:predicted ribosome quality control (RQC) complex YloA/Tae2 family protein
MDDRPWRDRDQLAALVQSWRADLVGRALFRVDGGPGWSNLLLDGDDRPGIYLGARTGANLLFDWPGPLPPPLPAALQRNPLPALADRLRGCRLTGVGLLPRDAVVAFAWRSDDDPPTVLTLQHQLFGPRGNVVLLDGHARLLWALHRPVHTVLTALPAGAWAAGPAQSASAGVRSAFRFAGIRYLARNLETAWHDRLHRALRRRKESAERLTTNLGRDFAAADRRADDRRDAETLAVHLHALRPGLSEVELPDPRDGRPRRIALDPALDAAANMERLFRRARKADRGHALIAERLAAAKAAGAALAAQQAELGAIVADRPPATIELSDSAAAVDVPRLAAPRLAALVAWSEDRPELLGGPVGAPRRRRARAPDEPARPFRRYLIDGRWEVWIGRSAAENDQLTHRAAALRDLWFHAQAAGGSHVILRTDGKPEQVPRRVLAKAAALAALHSKDRHAGTVPVIWTERRYVRKPRKAPPGTAVCLRHESLFAEPALPPGAEPI